MITAISNVSGLCTAVYGLRMQPL